MARSSLPRVATSLSAVRVPDKARYVCAAAALALIPICVASAFDRTAEFGSRPAPEFGLSWPNHARQRAIKQLTSGEKPAGAITQARLALSLDPTNPGAASALGSAYLLAGDADNARAAFLLAARGGWRDVPTQLYWLGMSVAEGDFGQMSLRLKALVQQGVSFANMRPAVIEAEKTLEGREQLATDMAKAPYALAYAEDGYQLKGADLENRMEVLILAATKGRLPPDVLIVAVSMLNAQERTDDLAMLWRSVMPAGNDPRKSVYNADFSQDLPSGPSAVLDWTPIESGAFEATITASGSPTGTRALRVSSTSSMREVVMRQGLLLHPGRYELRWRAAQGEGSRTSEIWPQITCADDVARDEVRDLANHRILFVIPTGCRGVAIKIWVEPPRPGSPDSVWIDDIRLSQAGAALQ